MMVGEETPKKLKRIEGMWEWVSGCGNRKAEVPRREQSLCQRAFLNNSIPRTHTCNAEEGATCMLVHDGQILSPSSRSLLFRLPEGTNWHLTTILPHLAMKSGGGSFLCEGRRDAPRR